MGRRIVDFRLESATEKRTALDSYSDKVVKFVPADVIAAWTTILGIVKATDNSSAEAILWACFAFGVAFTALWTWRQASAVGEPPPYVQVVVSTAAFVVWVIAIGAPFDKVLNPVIGPLLLVAFTLLSGLIPTNQKG